MEVRLREVTARYECELQKLQEQYSKVENESYKRA
jgi:hypothetical protein